MFVIAGCAPKPTPTPTPTPTTQPTTPPTDADCPKVVSTDVYTTYDATGCDSGCTACGTCSNPDPCAACNGETVTGNVYSNCWCEIGEEGVVPTCDASTGTFKIVITFDENIDPLASSCVYNPSNWTIKVKNSGRLVSELIASPYNVEVDGNKIIVDASVLECGTREIPDWCNTCEPVVFDYYFCGLICNLEEAACYANTVNGLRTAAPYGLVAAPTVADEIVWELSGGCVVSDELGNWCCGFSGSDCCVEPICETCEPCPIGSSACL
ncbi:hypothetical protein [Atribacter laminatus]|nr:hypothetical protein [Atribacter laminatus]